MERKFMKCRYCKNIQLSDVSYTSCLPDSEVKEAFYLEKAKERKLDKKKINKS